METKMKKSKKICAVVFAFLVLIVAFSFAFIKFSCSAKNSKENSLELRIQVPDGSNAKELGDELFEKGLIRSAKSFYLGARFYLFNRIFIHSKDRFSLKSGVYRLSSSMSLSEIYDSLTSGKQEYIRLSFPEGLTKSKIARRLEDAEVCSAKDFLECVQNPEIIKSYSLPSENLEGYLFPDTYFFTPEMKAESVVRTMVDNFFKHVSQIEGFENMSMEELDYTVRLASIVEREYRVPDEAPLIASVFENRLKYNWGLYSCATIEYIITEIEGLPHPDVITYKDLQIDSPYNTYKWAGLPPTAISNPGMIALEACVNTPKTKYFYFRLIDENEGRHVFTEDFSKHISEGYISSTKKASR